MKRLLSCLLMLALACPLLNAQNAPDVRHVEKIKRQIASSVDNQRRVAIETYDGRRLQGSVSEAGADSFVIADGGRSTTLNYGEIKKVRWPSEVSKQVKVAVGALAVTAVIFGLVVLLGGLKG